MKYFICLLLCLLIYFNQAKAKTSNIEVNFLEEVHEDVYFYSYFEPFYKLKDSIYRFEAGEEQKISFSLDIQTTQCICANYGPYECFFFIEPGASYKINFPEISKFEDSWKNNPYFQRSRLLPEITRLDKYKHSKDEKELNQALREFYKEYEAFTNNQLLNYYDPEHNQQKLDSFLIRDSKTLKVSDQEYYEACIFYSEGVLSFTGKKIPPKELIDKYFKNRKIRFNMPGYSQLFKLSFSDYYDYLRQEDKFNKIYSEFTRVSYQSLKEYLNQDVLMENDSIFETILLHEIYNAYYSGDYNKKRMISFVDSVYQASVIPANKTVSAYLLKKFTHLQPGYPAIDFTLESITGDTINLSLYKGKYLLLGFCELENINCLKEFEYLKYLYSRHHEYLKILSVISKSSNQTIRAFVERNNISWPMVSPDTDNKIFENYEIKSFPVFFLIGKNSKMILSPSPSPSQGFEQQLFRIMKSRGDI